MLRIALLAATLLVPQNPFEERDARWKAPRPDPGNWAVCMIPCYNWCWLQGNDATYCLAWCQVQCMAFGGDPAVH